MRRINHFLFLETFLFFVSIGLSGLSLACDTAGSQIVTRAQEDPHRELARIVEVKPCMADQLVLPAATRRTRAAAAPPLPRHWPPRPRLRVAGSLKDVHVENTFKNESSSGTLVS